MSSEVEQFYDSMADFYHLIFEDWNQAISRQAHIVDALIKYKLGTSSLRILDCACGIGTQVLGLAAIGHRLSGSDLSNEAVQRARHEAAKRELDVEFRVSDMTSLEEFSSDHFDVVGAFDNALPHLSVDQLAGAAHSFKRVTMCTNTSLSSEITNGGFITFHLNIGVSFERNSERHSGSRNSQISSGICPRRVAITNRS